MTNNLQTDTNWLPPQTAPKDGNVFLANIGYPWPVVCSWNGTSEKWAYADSQCGMYQGEWNDRYFENDWACESSLIAWQPLPNINKE